MGSKWIDLKCSSPYLFTSLQKDKKQSPTQGLGQPTNVWRWLICGPKTFCFAAYSGGFNRPLSIRDFHWDFAVVCDCVMVHATSLISADRCDCQGDPHCFTFDSRRHDYQGQCIYTMARDNCANGYPTGSPNFEVIGDFKRHDHKSRMNSRAEEIYFKLNDDRAMVSGDQWLCVYPHWFSWLKTNGYVVMVFSDWVFWQLCRAIWGFVVLAFGIN